MTEWKSPFQDNKLFDNFERDKGKEIDAGRAFLGQNKRRRRRDVFKHPNKVVGPRKG